MFPFFKAFIKAFITFFTVCLTSFLSFQPFLFLFLGNNFT